MGLDKDKRAEPQVKAWCWAHCQALGISLNSPVLHGHLCISALCGVSLYSNLGHRCLSPFSFASSKRYSCSIPELPVRSLDVTATAAHGQPCYRNIPASSVPTGDVQDKLWFTFSDVLRRNIEIPRTLLTFFCKNCERKNILSEGKMSPSQGLCPTFMKLYAFTKNNLVQKSHNHLVMTIVHIFLEEKSEREQRLSKRQGRHTGSPD